MRKTNEALKGRDVRIRSYPALSGLLNFALSLPRASPWAITLRPFRPPDVEANGPRKADLLFYIVVPNGVFVREFVFGSNHRKQGLAVFQFFAAVLRRNAIHAV